MRDVNYGYTNYTKDYPKCGNDNEAWQGKGCYNYKYGDTTNTDGFVTAVNKQTLCGRNDWRIPTKDELMKLVLSG